jgi:hypothetical protein
MTPMLYPEVKLGRWWLRGERRRARVYRTTARVFLGLGLLLLAGGAVTLVASLI